MDDYCESIDIFEQFNCALRHFADNAVSETDVDGCVLDCRLEVILFWLAIRAGLLTAAFA